MNKIMLSILVASSALSVAEPATRKDGAKFERLSVAALLTANPSGVTFTSRNGRLHGTDSDATITLLAKHRVEVVEYGVAVQTFTGTFSETSDGTLHFELRGYRRKWPDMSLYKHPKGTYLLPSENMPGLALGGAAPYWLFRRTK